MLRRIANHLFWAARYLERAEWRARLVDVNYHLLTENPPSAARDGWAPLLAITGDREDFDRCYSTLDEQSVLDFFTIDPSNRSSIRSCIALARENCRALRHRISSELWLEINSLYLDSLRWSPGTPLSHGVYGFFAGLRERFYRISGVIGNTIPRDLGYGFLDLGRMLESAENVTRLLDVKYHFLLPHPEDVGSPLDLSQWVAVLRSASALEAYRVTYGNAIRVEQVIQFLLFNETFPRAARFCIERVEADLAGIAAMDAGGRKESAVDAARALGLRLRAGVANSVVATGLHEYLLEIQDDCARIGDQLFVRYLKFE